MHEYITIIFSTYSLSKWVENIFWKNFHTITVWFIYKAEGECMWYNQKNPGDLGGGQMFNVELEPRGQYVRLIINDYLGLKNSTKKTKQQ